MWQHEGHSSCAKAAQWLNKSIFVFFLLNIKGSTFWWLKENHIKDCSDTMLILVTFNSLTFHFKHSRQSSLKNISFFLWINLFTHTDQVFTHTFKPYDLIKIWKRLIKKSGKDVWWFTKSFGSVVIWLHTNHLSQLVGQAANRRPNTKWRNCFAPY